MDDIGRQTDRSHLVVAMALQKSRKGQKPMELPSDVIKMLKKSSYQDAESQDDD